MDYINLLGVEGVQSAGRNISAAAIDMCRAAGAIQEAMQVFSAQINEFRNQVDRLEEMVKHK